MALILGAIGAVGVGTGVATLAAFIQFKVRRHRATAVENVKQLVDILEEGTHIMFVRKTVLYDHHALIGDITRKTDCDGKVVSMELYVYQFSSSVRKSKKLAHIGCWKVEMEKDEDGRWYIAHEYGVTDPTDTLKWNLEDRQLGLFPRLWVVRKDKYPRDEAGRAAAVSRARNCCGKELLKGKYKALVNNCEHFVTYCLTGKGHSYQTGRKWKKKYQRVVEAEQCRRETEVPPGYILCVAFDSGKEYLSLMKRPSTIHIHRPFSLKNCRLQQ